MAVGISARPRPTLNLVADTFSRPPFPRRCLFPSFPPSTNCVLSSPPLRSRQKRSSRTVYLVLHEGDKSTADNEVEIERTLEESRVSKQRAMERTERKKTERTTYLVAAIMSSFGITSMAIVSVYYLFAWQFEGGEILLTEMFGTFALSVGAAVSIDYTYFLIYEFEVDHFVH